MGTISQLTWGSECLAKQSFMSTDLELWPRALGLKKLLFLLVAFNRLGERKRRQADRE